MHIQSIRTLAGPNIYSHRPILLMRLDLAALDEKETVEFKGFNDRLLSVLPGLNEHHCSLGRAGGFVQRLAEGTLFGHVVEHVAIELSILAELGTNHGKTRYAGEPRIYNIAIEYKAEQATRYLFEASVRLVTAILRSEIFPIGKEIWEAKQIAARTEWGPSTRAIVHAAEKRNIPCRREGDGSIVQLGYGKHLHYIQAAMTDLTSATAVELVQNKEYTKALLRRAAIPVPEGRTVRSGAEAISAMREFGPPVVVKPLTGRQGEGVTIGVETDEEMVEAFEDAVSYEASVLVEQMLEGRNYRLLIVNNQMIAASERIPSTVLGDGEHSIKELVEIENKNPLRGKGHEKPLTRIEIDHSVLQHLKKLGLTPKHVPADGEEVALSECVNLSTGATARDVTDKVHSSIKLMCERAARLAGVNICGVDLIAADISRPLVEGGILELNAGPGLRMHCYPSEGAARDVGGAIIDMLYPTGENGRIPIFSITGTNGKTTVTRAIGHVLQAYGKSVGMTTTDGIYVGGVRVAEGDTTGPRSAQAVLSDPLVEVAVLETARGGIVRGGLGYDWSDVAVITNVREDHLGQDGIKDLDDVVFIKSLVAERVREGGTLILNADDERVVGMAELRSVANTPKRTFYFSLNPNNSRVREHLHGGGTAFYLRDGWLIEATGSKTQKIVEAFDVPITFGGAADFQIENMLAAVAACRAHGVPKSVVASSLRQFTSCASNPGRVNLYQLNGGHLLVDYGHNADAFEAICRLAGNWRDRRVTGVIGVPGDRADVVIRNAGTAAAKGFHRLIVREDHDLRGRTRGAVADILCDAVRKAAPDTSCEVVLDEAEALQHAVTTMERNEVVVLFYEKLEPLAALLEKYAAQPVTAIDRLGEARRTTDTDITKRQSELQMMPAHRAVVAP